MRRKAEQKIRAAAALLGTSDLYRIDQVRAKAGLVPKVFDKTLLDMARLKTVELKVGDPKDISAAESDNLIDHKGTRYRYFRFLHPPSPAILQSEPMEPQIPEPAGIEREQWRKFQYLCEKREGKTAAKKLCEMINDYLKNSN